MTKTERKRKRLIEKTVRESHKLFEDGKPSTLFEDVAKELEKSEHPFPFGHAAQQSRDRDWSILEHQVVGAEDY